MSTLEDLLRRIEDAIDAHIVDVRAGLVQLDGRQGPAVVRAVLEQPLPDVDVCPDCRGIGHRIVDGTRSPVWCRPCNGIGYVTRTVDPCPVAGCGCRSIANHEPSAPLADDELSVVP